MAKANKNGTRRKLDKSFWVFLFLAILYLGYLYYSYKQQNYDTDLSVVTVEEYQETSQASSVQGTLHVYMIDCGQADSFLFEQDGKYALIDAGTRSSGKDVADFINSKGVEKLEFIIGTHPHDDHMGGMYDVLNSVECDKLFIPDFNAELVTTNWYKKLVAQIKTMQITVIHPKVMDVIYLGDARFEVVGQLDKEQAGKNLNNYSTVIKVSFGEMDLLMTGDAEDEVEKAILNSGVDIQCEMLKLGHHGSDSSTCDEFLKEVNPDYGLISCGVGNKYEHPCESTMKKLKKKKVKVYRTDEQSTVSITITEDSIEFDQQPGDYLSGVQYASKKGVKQND